MENELTEAMESTKVSGFIVEAGRWCGAGMGGDARKVMDYEESKGHM